MSVPWRSYVAIGDSFTEGLWDPYPGEQPVRPDTAPSLSEPSPTSDPGDDEGWAGPEDEPALRGWADRLAVTLSRRRLASGQSPLTYANLAIRGRPLRRILREQLEPALQMKPDLISVVGGGIDVLRLGADPDKLAQLLEDAVIRARATGARVLLATCMDTRGGGLLGAIRPRMALYSAHISSIARRHDCAVLDQWGLGALGDLRMWASDRIHLSPEGHHRLSQAALVGLGLTPDDARYLEPLPPTDAQPPVERWREHGAWLRRDVAPWVGRGIRRRSTGDHRPPKRPQLEPLVPEGTMVPSAE